LSHTPGPWLATPTTGNPHNPNSLRMDIVTTTGEWNPAFVAGDILPEDARLIASAPDLLAALEVVLSSTCGNVGDDGYEGCIRIEAKALDRAIAAISKAKGNL
jgi:hypothetical protein